ncbi:MAG: Slp family lipoprotein [Dokdonella sp.]
MTRFFRGISFTASISLGASLIASGADPATSKVFSSPVEAANGTFEGATVLWGGCIFERETSEGQHCIGVVAFPLSRKDGRPDTGAQPGQIFHACSAVALDANDYAAGARLQSQEKSGPFANASSATRARTCQATQT